MHSSSVVYLRVSNSIDLGLFEWLSGAAAVKKKGQQWRSNLLLLSADFHTHAQTQTQTQTATHTRTRTHTSTHPPSRRYKQTHRRSARRATTGEHSSFFRTRRWPTKQWGVGNVPCRLLFLLPFASVPSPSFVHSSVRSRAPGRSPRRSRLPVDEWQTEDDARKENEHDEFKRRFVPGLLNASTSSE